MPTCIAPDSDTEETCIRDAVYRVTCVEMGETDVCLVHLADAIDRSFSYNNPLTATVTPVPQT